MGLSLQGITWQQLKSRWHRRNFKRTQFHIYLLITRTAPSCRPVAHSVCAWKTPKSVITTCAPTKQQSIFCKKKNALISADGGRVGELPPILETSTLKDRLSPQAAMIYGRCPSEIRSSPMDRFRGLGPNGSEWEVWRVRSLLTFLHELE